MLCFLCSFSAFCVRFFLCVFLLSSFLVVCVALWVSFGHSFANGSLFSLFAPKKKAQKMEHFFTLAKEEEFLFASDELFSRGGAVLFFFSLHKKRTHAPQKMNVLSTHAVALHGMNARGSQRTTSASTSSLIARKNTRSYNTKKNINAARHHQQRSIIRYVARQ